MHSTRVEDFLRYWRSAGAGNWFGKDPAFDRELHTRFLPLHEAAAARVHEAELADQDGALGLVLLLDQFPRNAFRGTPRMYETDPLARENTTRALDAGFDERVARELRFFFYLPLSHSENLADQELSVQLHRKLSYTENAERHCSIIRQFGRFPHRNPILGRETTPEERAFLDAGGFSG